MQRIALASHGLTIIRDNFSYREYRCEPLTQMQSNVRELDLGISLRFRIELWGSGDV